MAVIAKWLCDRDDSMFDSKKEAEAHDKMLELAEQFTKLLLEKMPEANAAKATEVGLLLANNKDKVIEACKGNPQIIAELGMDESSNIMPLHAEA